MEGSRAPAAGCPLRGGYPGAMRVPPHQPQPSDPARGAQDLAESGLACPCVAGGGLSPGCPRSPAVSTLRWPSSGFALLSSIPPCPELPLGPWGWTTLVQSPVPPVPSYRSPPCARTGLVGAGRRGRRKGGSALQPPQHNPAPKELLCLSPTLSQNHRIPA